LAGVGAVWVLCPAPWPGRWLGVAMLLGMLAPGVSPVSPGGLRVTVLDVGQGLSVLVQTADHALLYDAGPAFRASDAGERVVVPALQALGVRELDVLVISHADADHRGGARSVLERYSRARVVGPVGGRRVVAAGPNACHAGMAWRWDGVDFRVLHPAAHETELDDNAGSCVLRISAPGASLLLTGDIPASIEGELASLAKFSAVDLLLAPHHGSRTSSSAPLVQATRSRYVVFAVGYRNRWHFPAREVVDRWRQSGACLLSTAEAGALQLETGPDTGFRLVRAERVAASGVWLARPAEMASCR
ncbi:MAG: ComEC/Rec2 family competence protein, partial [Gammaproteobacteria bacterium]